MSEQFNKKPSLAERLKNSRVSRPAIVSTCLLLIAAIVITTVAIIGNREKQNDAPLPDKTPITDPTPVVPDSDTDGDEDKDTDDKQEGDKETDADVETVPTEDKLPSFSLPVSGAIFKKHDPTLQVFSNTMKDYRVHLGVDITTEASAPVYAAADGKIDKLWEDTLMGYCIAIKHSGNCYTIYKNLAKELPDGIAEGVSVRAGQLIASVGDSAMIEIADEPHLHFEMTVADLSVDPLKYFDEKALSSLGIDASYGE